jgi:transcriptional regulator with GAF, ATPase, and Fis domain
MIRLEVIKGSDEGLVFESDAFTLGLGRAADNELVLGDQHISGRHGQVVLKGDTYLYRDLRSTNGSAVQRGERLILIDESVESQSDLQDGDRLLLGDKENPTVLSVRIGAPVEEETRFITVKPVSEIGELRDRDADSLARLYKVQQQLSQDLDLNQILDRIADAVFELTAKATHLTIVLRDDEGEHFVPMHTRERGKMSGIEPIPISQSLFRKVVKERSAVLAANAMEDLGRTESLLGANILSTMGVPLWKGDEVIGVIQVDNRASPGIFRERDLEMLTIAAGQASLSLANARLYQKLKLAEERLSKENLYLRGREQERRFKGIIGESPAMQAVFRQLSRVVDTRVTVLIEGETGTGKELVASAIHYQSKRHDKLFVAQNCAAVPENLLESELFGHKKGAYTGADQDKKGLFELADGGTMFLDEVAEMPFQLQSKLLRVLQEGEVRPLGATVSRKVDVRIVAATNRNLEAEVQQGRFREDLYYRLRVFPLVLPPLRERREDIPLLAAHFLEKYTREYCKEVGGLSQAARELLTSYAWPGNVRELENEMQRIVIQVDQGGFVLPEHLSPRIRQVETLLDKIAPKKGTLKEMMAQVERWILSESLREHNGNKSATAKSLGITREGLHKKLNKYDM